MYNAHVNYTQHSKTRFGKATQCSCTVGTYDLKVLSLCECLGIVKIVYRVSGMFYGNSMISYRCFVMVLDFESPDFFYPRFSSRTSPPYVCALAYMLSCCRGGNSGFWCLASEKTVWGDKGGKCKEKAFRKTKKNHENQRKNTKHAEKHCFFPHPLCEVLFFLLYTPPSLPSFLPPFLPPSCSSFLPPPPPASLPSPLTLAPH